MRNIVKFALLSLFCLVSASSMAKTWKVTTEETIYQGNAIFGQTSSTNEYPERYTGILYHSLFGKKDFSVIDNLVIYYDRNQVKIKYDDCSWIGIISDDGKNAKGTARCYNTPERAWNWSATIYPN